MENIRKIERNIGEDMQFPVIIHKDTGSVYGVIVPDIAGCYSSGETIDDAIRNAKEAIFMHLETMLEMNIEPSISVSSIDELRKNKEYVDATWGLVEVDLSSLDSKPERVNISLPRFVLHRIDEHVQKQHETRSGFLVRAALKELAHE